MVSIAASTEHYKQAFTPEQAKVLVEGAVAIEHDLVNREDFSKLTAIVERLADRMGGLGERMEELAGAQKQTDSRMDRLAERMDALAESQQSMQRTFERFMVRTEEQFTSVRQEFRETTGALEQKMDASFADVRKQLGGLSLSVGMGLEAYALDKIPRLLEMHCGFKTESVFPETFTDGGRTEEIDVVGRLAGAAGGDPADQSPGGLSDLAAMQRHGRA